MALQPLTDAQLEEIAEIALTHYQGQQIDWHDLLDRAENSLDLDLGGDMTDPEIKRIKRHVNKARRDANT